MTASPQAKPDSDISVTSLEVAEYFEKRHAVVLNTLRKLKRPGEFKRQHFTALIYRVRGGQGAMLPQPYYEMTREGFAALALSLVAKRERDLTPKIPLIIADVVTEVLLAQVLSKRLAADASVAQQTQQGA